MGEPTQNRVYAAGAGAPALQKFLDARASGTASSEEMTQLKMAAEDEAAHLSAIDQSTPNWKDLDQFLSDINLRPRVIGTCGLSKKDKCGMKDPRECRIHHH